MCIHSKSLAYALTLLMLTFSTYATAGRLPNTLERIEYAGPGYLKIYSANSETSGEYHIINNYDVKRLVGGGEHKHCYMFYLTGAELVKLPIVNQSCDAALQELIKTKR